MGTWYISLESQLEVVLYSAHIDMQKQNNRYMPQRDVDDCLRYLSYKSDERHSIFALLRC
ncbi:hypothetical protein NQ314_018237 [Rhamnusium bicolor]|uniref:Uncharacterized protein n=1 Tax=Rhamnusium bicolor TaxID=1586634 RepID=A0AAV8WRS5_9CUCU|nr:hypothetical protein NQ314_018237 [Rhamnusium bicolor]